MEINLIIDEDGELAIAVPDGEFDVASAALKEFIRTLEAGDIPIVTGGGEPEMHKKAQKFIDAKVNLRR